MKPKGRYNIGVAQRSGVSVVEDVSSHGIEDFLSIYQETFARKGKRGRSPSYFHSLIRSLYDAKCGSIFFAEYEGMRAATGSVQMISHFRSCDSGSVGLVFRRAERRHVHVFAG